MIKKTTSKYLDRDVLEHGEERVEEDLDENLADLGAFLGELCEQTGDLDNVPKLDVGHGLDREQELGHGHTHALGVVVHERAQALDGHFERRVAQRRIVEDVLYACGDRCAHAHVTCVKGELLGQLLEEVGDDNDGDELPEDREHTANTLDADLADLWAVVVQQVLKKKIHVYILALFFFVVV